MLSTRVRCARLADLPGVAAVLQDSFDDKMRVIFGRQPGKIRALLEAIYTGPVERGYDGVLVAERGGRIIGTLLIEPMDHTPEENRAFEHFAVRELGLPRMMWASFLLWLLGHHPEPGEAYISDVGVAGDYQGQGVGQMLMEYAEAWAWQHGRRRITLWVAGTNNRAIHVYQKAGFAAVRTRSSFMTRLAFGIRDWHFMEKQRGSGGPDAL
ncbi:MAG: GNAT family N-acetyltransferase [Anaerolineae bacterium]|jgi:ribosomal protein S18 acetylase RimI-like enzyme|nr:GNAT family N-acetyltransferase [Anaerolineae bacterium]